MIQRIRIKNFRSFRDFDLELGRNNVVVGANNSGKSNLVDFFKFVRDLLVPAQSGLFGVYSAFNSRNGIAEVIWKGGDTPVIGFQLEGQFVHPIRGETKWTYTVEMAGNLLYNNAEIKSEELTLNLGDTECALIKTNGRGRVILGNEGQQIVQVSDSTRLALEQYLQDWAGNDVRSILLSWRFYNLVPPLMKIPNPTAAPSSLNVLGDNLSAWLMLLQTRYAESYAKVRRAFLDAFPDVSDVFCTPTEQAKVYVTSKEKGLLRPLTVSLMSDGELAFLALLSLIYAPKELGAAFHCIEEPENHLHPRLLTVLVDLLHQVQTELGKEAGQLLITTHSLHLIDRFSIDDLVVLKKEGGATVPLRPRDVKDLREILASNEVGLGDLYYSGALTVA